MRNAKEMYNFAKENDTSFKNQVDYRDKEVHEFCEEIYSIIEANASVGQYCLYECWREHSIPKSSTGEWAIDVVQRELRKLGYSVETKTFKDSRMKEADHCLYVRWDNLEENK